MGKFEQKKHARQTPVSAGTEAEVKPLGDVMEPQIPVSQEDIEATLKESQANLEASSKVMAALDASGDQLDRVMQEIERQIERSRELLRSGTLDEKATRELTEVLGEVVPELYAVQSDLGMTTRAVLGTGKDGLSNAASPDSKSGKAPRRRGRMEV